MKFISKSSEHTLIRRPADRIMDELRRPIILRGERANFVQHQYNTDDEDMIQWLLTHPRYGIDFTSAEVKDKPEAKPPAEVKVPLMVRGANATAYAPPKEEVVRVTQETMQAVPWATKEDVSKMLDERLEPMMERILIAINAMGQTPNRPVTASEPPTLLVNKYADIDLDELASYPGKVILTNDVNAVRSLGTGKERHLKKVFHCPICHKEFNSGIAVGRHKKEAHK